MSAPPSTLSLFAAAPPVLSVSQVNAQARALLERHLARCRVAGEISNLRPDANGNFWLCLKDRGAVLSAVVFRRDAPACRAALRDGAQVTATGRLTIYPASGRYQMVISELALQGEGALQAAFSALKARLGAEGLFAAERKRALPPLPRRVAAITSPTGSVIRDIVQVAGRRFPNFQLLLVPARVQGAEAASSLLQALQAVARLHRVQQIDAVILARGGGSLEDMCGFNDERVARALAACPVPTVSAVGHETDFTIADFVADVRAPTPSAAAEIVFPRKSELTLRLRRLQDRSTTAVSRELERQRLRLRALRAELGDGRGAVTRQAQRLALVQARVERSLRQRVAQARQRLAARQARLAALHPRVRLAATAQRLHHAVTRLRLLAPRLLASRRDQLAATSARPRGPLLHLLRARRQALAGLAQRLHALSPLAVLGRGYGIVLTADGRAVRGAEDAPPGTALDLRVARGRLFARVEAPPPAAAGARQRKLTS